MKKKLFYPFVCILILFILVPNIRESVISKVDEWRRAELQLPINTPKSGSNEESSASVEINGEAAILIDQDTGDILYRKNERERMYPASTTKIVTTLIALEKGNLHDSVTIGNEVELKEKGESTAFLYEGQTLTLEQLLSGLMLSSGNDAARSIAVYIAKKESGNAKLSTQESIDFFADLMNKKAKELGAEDSHFINPHGLHHDNHYSTAYDMGIIAKAAMNNRDFKEIVNQDQYADHQLTYRNTNQLLNQNSDVYYQGANGIKTGFTSRAGSCLVSSATKGNRNLIAVVLKSTKDDVWNDSISLLDSGFSSFLVER